MFDGKYTSCEEYYNARTSTYTRERGRCGIAAAEETAVTACAFFLFYFWASGRARTRVYYIYIIILLLLIRAEGVPRAPFSAGLLTRGPLQINVRVY